MPYTVTRVRTDVPAAGAGLTHIASVPEDGLARLLTQYVSSPRVQGLIASFLVPVQALDDTAIDAIQALAPDNASGVLLDRLGRFVGEDRKGRSDSSYRRAIRTRIRVNRSLGQAEDLIEVSVLFVGQGPVNVQDVPGHAVTVDVLAEVAEPDWLMRYLLLSKAAGVSLFFVYTPSLGGLESFCMSSLYAAPETSDPQGFGSVYTGAIGGVLGGAFSSIGFNPTLTSGAVIELLTRAGQEIQDRSLTAITIR